MDICYTLEEILEILGEGRREGETTRPITGIASLESGRPGDLSFLGNAKYRKSVPGSKASVILLPEGYEGLPGKDQVYLFVKNPSFALSLICARIEKMIWPRPRPGIHPSACIDQGATIDRTAWIGPHCSIGAEARIGPEAVLEGNLFVARGADIGPACWLSPHVLVGANCRLLSRVRLHPGVIVGAEGYGFEKVEGKHRKLPQIGNVIIEEDVEIGANTTIDRARFGATRIGRGTKIDNLVQIGHNVRIGKYCLIVAQAGISGSTVLEDNVVMGGQAGTVGHIRIGERSMLGAQAGVNRDLPPRSKVRGTPAYPIIQAQRVEILRRRLPELFKRVSRLEELLETGGEEEQSG